MRRLLESEGIPPSMIWTEVRSKTTHENAVYGYEILRQHGISRIALVVYALSMPTAGASFRKQGVVVVPAAFGSSALEIGPQYSPPTGQSSRVNDATAHAAL